jgi:hypothetical protein
MPEFPPGMRRIDPDAEAARLAEERKQPLFAGIGYGHVLQIITVTGPVRVRVVAVEENGPEVILHTERIGG